MYTEVYVILIANWLSTFCIIKKWSKKQYLKKILI